MEKAVVELAFDTIVLLVLLAVFFLAIYAPIRARHPIPYVGGLFALNMIVAAAALVWSINLREFIAIATFNLGGFLFGLLFAGLGVYLLIVSLRDRIQPIALPVTIVCTGVLLALISCVS